MTSTQHPADLLQEVRHILREAINTDSWRHRSTLMLKADARLAKIEVSLNRKTS